MLATLVEAYERRRWPVETKKNPVELLNYLIDEAGHTQQELAEVIGSKSRASEILARKRALTLEMIAKISEAWAIPVELLATPYDVVKPKAKAKTRNSRGRALRGHRKKAA